MCIFMNVNKIVQKMSLREKIEQLTQIVYTSENFEEIKERLRRECIGSLILSTNATAGNTKLVLTQVLKCLCRHILP